MHGARLVALAGAFLATACIAGCGGDDDRHPADPGPQLTRVYVSNYSPDQITAVHVRPVGESDWGPNLLTGTIYGGDSSTFIGEFEEGRYDLRLVGNLQTVEYLDQRIVGDYIGFGYWLTAHQ